MDTDRSRITLGQVSADLLMVGTPAASDLHRRRMERLIREALPERLGRRLEERLEGWSGVVRMGRLELELDVAVQDLAGSDLAETWAGAVAAALERELARGAGANLVRFDSAGDYLAAYVVERLTGRRSPPWVFPDFAPLRHLSPEDAAAELLSARPGHLPALAHRLGSELGAGVFALRLGEERARRTLEAAAHPASPSGVDPVDVAHLLGDAPPPSAPPHVAALSLLLQRWGGSRATYPGAAAALFLAGVLGELGESGSPTQSPGGPVGEEGASARPASSPGTPHLNRLRRTPQGRGVLARLRREAATEVPPASIEGTEPPPPSSPSPLEAAEPAPVTAKAPDRADVPSRALRSAFAGLALALPVIRALDLHAHLGPTRLRALLLALVESDLRPLLRTEGTLAILVPEEEAEGTRAMRVPEEEAEAAVPAEEDALLVGEHLAQRLYGLTRSSLPYLRDQFIQRPGWIHLSEAELHIHLDPVPLAVVLRMSGQLGGRGTLPWAGDRELRITMGEP